MELRCRRWLSGRLQFGGGNEGFTIVESLIAVLILTASVAGLVALTSRSWSSSSAVDVMEVVENAVTSDLGWLKTYARIWRMSSGPYNLTAAQTRANTFTFSTSFVTYEPDEVQCSNAAGLAQSFVTDAGDNTADRALSLTPVRPFAVATGTTALSGIGLPTDLALNRNIRVFPTDSVPKNMIYVSYSLSGANASSYRFNREVALRLEAVAWCP